MQVLHLSLLILLLLGLNASTVLMQITMAFGANSNASNETTIAIGVNSLASGINTIAVRY